MTQKNHNKVTFLLADDHSLIRQGISFLIDELDFETEILQTSNLQETLNVIQEKHIDIAVIDAHFPDGNSLSQLRKMKQTRAEMKILIFTGIDEDAHALKYIKSGANGFLSKMSEEDEIRNALTQMVEVGEYISSTLQTQLIESVQNPSLVNPLYALTERELEVAEKYAEGLGNLEIANQLNIKQNTVSTLKKRILYKLNLENLVELVEMVKNHDTK